MKNFILIILVLSFNFVFSQKEGDPKYEFHYADVSPIKNDAYILKITDAHSQQTFTKFRLHLTNNTTDYLVLNTNKISFIYDFGILHPKEKEFIINPGETLNKVITVSDASKDFHVKNLKVKFGGIYKLSSKGEIVKLPDFQLPANTNFVESDNLTCKLLNLKKETKQTAVQFKCNYKGNDYMILTPAKATLKIKDGREFAPVNRKVKTKILEKNDKKKFTLYYEIQAKIVDMQFATMNIVWHDTFTESKAEPIDCKELELKFDEEKTKAKNN